MRHTYLGPIGEELRRQVGLYASDASLTSLYLMARPEDTFFLRLVYHGTFGLVMRGGFWASRSALVAPDCSICGWTGFLHLDDGVTGGCGECRKEGGLPSQATPHRAIEVTNDVGPSLASVLTEWLDAAPLLNPLQAVFLRERASEDLQSLYGLLAATSGPRR